MLPNIHDSDSGNTAGEVYGVSRAAMHPLVRGLGWLYKNPVKWFRPTHVGIGLVEILRARNPHAGSLKGLAKDVQSNPIRSVAVAAPAFLLNFLTGYTMFWRYSLLSGLSCHWLLLLRNYGVVSHGSLI